MKKFSRREKNILKMMFMLVLIAILSEVYDRYTLAKESLSESIISDSEETTAYLTKMGKETTEDYREKTKAVDLELEELHKRVLRLPTEADASLLIRQTITEIGDKAGVKINSLSERRSQVAGTAEGNSDKPGDEKKTRELRAYFAFEAELASLVKFFDALGKREYYMSVSNLTISARQQIRRLGGKQVNMRMTLTGSAVMVTMFEADPEGKSTELERSVKLLVLPELVVKELPEPKPDPKPGVKGPQVANRPGSSLPNTAGNIAKPQPTRPPVVPSNVPRLPPSLVPQNSGASTPPKHEEEPDDQADQGDQDEGEQGEDEDGEDGEEDLAPIVLTQPPVPQPKPAVTPPKGNNGLAPNVSPIKPPTWQPTPKPQSGTGVPIKKT